MIMLEVSVNGAGLPPPSSIVPAELEKVGSVVQREKAEPVLEREVTESFDSSKLISVSTALTPSPSGLTSI